jgi:homoserine dehydrogenase
MNVEQGTALAAASGVEGVLEVELRDGAVLRISGPGAGGPVSVGAVYADLARLVAGERPILFGATS